MNKESRPAKLWEWSSQTGKDDASVTKISLSCPEDAQQSGTTLIPVVNKTFQNETIIIDGRNFINCEFRECKIQWNGNDFIFTTCLFSGSQKLVTSLPEIAAAIQLANACQLLNENTQCQETRPPRKVNK